MNCRRALRTDYTELCRWWEGHGWPAVPEQTLPTGWVIEKDGVLLAAGFLYMARNAPVGYFEYVVTNPDNTARDTYKALDLLFTEVMTFARYNLIQVCFARIGQASLGKMYEKHGFTVGDKVTDMVWTI